MISPEEFKAEIDKAIEMGHMEGSDHIRNVVKANPGIRTSREHVTHIKDFVNSLSDEQRREAIELNPDHKAEIEQTEDSLSDEIMISPEEFKAEVDKAIEMGKVDGSLHIKNIIKANPDIVLSKEHIIQIKAFADALL
jgi:hypothetical protein